jgi:hypothetical protein
MTDTVENPVDHRELVHTTTIPAVSASQMAQAYLGAVTGLPYSVHLSETGLAKVTLSSGHVVTIRLAHENGSACMELWGDGLPDDDWEEMQRLQIHLHQTMAYHARVIFARARAAA